mmetsp:Transcript_21334/g.39826  ORF Transcript_21334/g.39826 Transcript_21334/m.39826 type:complete len:757 (-) Transcript_21334:266-2536(-)
MKKSSPLVFNTELNDAATDLDKLVAQGFEESVCRDALAMAKGNVPLALQQLREASRGDGTTSRLTWVGEVEGEWRDKDMAPGEVMGGVMSAEARALWKSPYYIRIGDFTRDKKSPNSKTKDLVFYTVMVSSRDGQSWKLTKSLSDFYSFWINLPFGMGLHSKLHLKTGFPLMKLNSLSLKSAVLGTFRNQMTEQEIEDRRVLLENWLRELCLDEDCMTNAPFLAALENFVEADKNKNMGKPPAIMPLPSKGVRRTSTADLHSWVKLPAHTTTSPFPVSYADMQASLPTKLDLEEVFGDSYQDSNALAESITDKDTTVKQLAKDMSRDRVVIQGKRYQGVDCGLDELIEEGILAAQKALDEGNALPISKEALSELTLRSLRQISRTESAFVSHTALSLAISLQDTPDLAIVPESLLAEPLRIHYRVDKENKKGANQTSTTVKKASPIPSAPPKQSAIKPGLETATVDARVVSDSAVVISPYHPTDTTPPPLPTATPITGSDSIPIATLNPFGDNSATVGSRDSSSSGSKHSTVPLPRKSPMLRDNTSSRSGPKTATNHVSPLLKPVDKKSTSSSGSHKKMPLPVPLRRSSQSSPPHPASTPKRRAERKAENLICDLQATTVFRFTNIMTMQCALQLRVTYCKSIKLFHTCADGSSLTEIVDEVVENDESGSVQEHEKASSDQLSVNMANDETDKSRPVSTTISSAQSNNNNNNDDDAVSVVVTKHQPTAVYKSSKCFVILERETQTSSRDWRHDQKL